MDKAGDGDDGDNGRDGDMDSTTISGGSVDSTRVCQSRRMQNNDLLVSSGPPTKRADRLNGLVGRRCRCRRLKIERINSVRHKNTKRLTWDTGVTCSHTEMLRNVGGRSINQGDDADTSRHDLQTLVERTPFYLSHRLHPVLSRYHRRSVAACMSGKKLFYRWKYVPGARIWMLGLRCFQLQ